MLTALLSPSIRQSMLCSIGFALLLSMTLNASPARAQMATWDRVTVWADIHTWQPGDGLVIESYDAQGNPIVVPDAAPRLERALAALPTGNPNGNSTGCLGVSGQFYVSRPIDISRKCILGVHYWREVGFEIIAAQGHVPGAHVWAPEDAVLFANQAFKLEGANVYGEEIAAYGISVTEIPVRGVSEPPQIEIRDTSIQDTVAAGLYVARSGNLLLDNLSAKRNQADGIVLDQVTAATFETVRSDFNLGSGIKILGDYPATPATPGTPGRITLTCRPACSPATSPPAP